MLAPTHKVDGFSHSVSCSRFKTSHPPVMTLIVFDYVWECEGTVLKPELTCFEHVLAFFSIRLIFLA